MHWWHPENFVDGDERASRREAQGGAAHGRDVPLPRRAAGEVGSVPVRLDLLRLRLLCRDARALDPRHGRRPRTPIQMSTR